MSHKISELTIRCKGEGKGKSKRFRAYCPLCMYSHAVHALTGDEIAADLARQNIIGHLYEAHKDEIETNA